MIQRSDSPSTVATWAEPEEDAAGVRGETEGGSMLSGRPSPGPARPATAEWGEKCSPGTGLHVVVIVVVLELGKYVQRPI